MVLVKLDLAELEAKLDKAAAEIAVEIGSELVNQLKVESPVGATNTLTESFQIFRTDDDTVYYPTVSCFYDELLCL